MSLSEILLPLGIGRAEILPIGVMTSARNGINICLRNYQRAVVVCQIRTGGNGTQDTFTFAQSSGAAGDAVGVGEKALTNNIERWWYSDDASLTPDGAQDTTWTEGTAAKSWQPSNAQNKTHIACFDIVPEEVMDIQSGFDCITVNTAGSNSAHYGEVHAILYPRYKPPLTVTTDNAADISWSVSSSASASRSASASAS